MVLLNLMDRQLLTCAKLNASSIETAEQDAYVIRNLIISGMCIERLLHWLLEMMDNVFNLKPEVLHTVISSEIYFVLLFYNFVVMNQGIVLKCV